ncbi:hypothetical protein GCM10009638_24660 [Luteococcus sanguinis]
MEGAGLHLADAQAVQPAAHLAGGAGGEGDCQDCARIHVTGAGAVRDPVRDGAGLARPGTGDHGDGTTKGRCDLALLIVQRAKDVVGSVHDQRPYAPRLMPPV